jgi:predicted hydrolase (HD superfamily)
MTAAVSPHAAVTADPVHDLANVLNAIQASVGYLLAACPLPGETRDVVVDLQLCVDRFPELLGRLRVTSQFT